MTGTTTGTARYAAAVVQMLSGHFTDLTDPVTAEVVTDLVERQARNPDQGFEVIVDNPVNAKWRLRADRQDRHHVRLLCYRLHPRDADVDLERTVNEALILLAAEGGSGA